MKQLSIYIFVGIIVSFYLFPIGLTFLPSGLNTKSTLAAFGAVFYFFEAVRNRNFSTSIDMLGAIGFAVLFSWICLYSTSVNYTDDYSYANYYVSFFVWLGGAYATITIIRRFHGSVNFRTLVFYLTAVCTIQCILAIMIDRMPTLKNIVDAYVFQGQGFLNEINRLYGIGASLDQAGIRFSVVLIMLATLLTKDAVVRSNKVHLYLLLLSFFIISVIGNMIARTTSVGMTIGFVYLIWNSGILKLVIKKENMKFFIVFAVILTFVVIASAYLYNTDAKVHQNMRFAFEGFFNWVETGVWETSSTTKLNTQMWIWPDDGDIKTWTIGTGVFGLFTYGTDIGYCRFVLYCGIVGFSAFALFFIYHVIVFARKVPKYRLMFILLGALGFIIWVKVATDTFFIYALFYCLKNEEWKEDENPIPLLEPTT